ncbi:MAG TPA: HAD family phosphatase [Mycobacteriales bacterium]|nr:HAD family phosphatase [Mycobacteriales bacterium]
MSRRLEAVLWDMDGLLVDTEPLWTRAEHELAAHHGATFTAAAKAAVVGTRLEVAAPLLLQHAGVPVTPAEVAWASSFLLERMVELFAEPLPLAPGAGTLLAELAAAGVPMALVSSSYRVLVDAVLARGVGPFATTVAGDEVERGKPHPQPYLLAADRLGVDPARCVVLEDSPPGIASGTAAGCAVVAVPTLPGVVVAPAARRRVVRSLEDVDVAGLRELLDR